MNLKINLKELKDEKEINFLERLRFVEYWVNYIRTHNDKEWSRQQKNLIDSQFQIADRFYKELAETPEGREKIKKLRELKLSKHHFLTQKNQ